MPWIELLLMACFAAIARITDVAATCAQDDATSARGLLVSDPYAMCPIGREERQQFVIHPDEDRFVEISYMVHSNQRFADHSVVWVGSDGPQNELAAVDLVTGRIIQILLLDLDVVRDDWEAISLGPCSSTEAETCIYIGAVGNNAAHRCKMRPCLYGRDKVKIYKFKEPDITSNQNTTSVEFSTLLLDYHDKDLPIDRADSETIFVDFTGDDMGGKKGDIFLVTHFPKQEHLQRVVKVPVEAHEMLRPTESRSVSVVPVGVPQKNLSWTGGDMTSDGSLIALRDLRSVYFFPRPRTLSVGMALGLDPCSFVSNTKLSQDQHHFETVAMVGTSAMMEASECTKSERCSVPVSIYELNYDQELLGLSDHLFYPSRQPSLQPSQGPSLWTFPPTQSPSHAPNQSSTYKPNKNIETVVTAGLKKTTFTAPTPQPSASPINSNHPGNSPKTSESISISTEYPSIQPTQSPSLSPSQEAELTILAQMLRSVAKGARAGGGDEDDDEEESTRFSSVAFVLGISATAFALVLIVAGMSKEPSFIENQRPPCQWDS